MAPKSKSAPAKVAPAKAVKAAPAKKATKDKKFTVPEESAEVIKELDDSFVAKPKGGKCTGHKFTGLVLYELGKEFGIRSGESLNFYCDDARVCEAYGAFDDAKAQVCKGSMMVVGELDEEGEDKETMAKKAAPRKTAKKTAAKADKPAKKAPKAAAKPKAAKKAAAKQKKVAKK